MIRKMIKIQYCPFKRDLPLIVSARDQGENSNQNSFDLKSGQLANTHYLFLLTLGHFSKILRHFCRILAKISQILYHFSQFLRHFPQFLAKTDQILHHFSEILAKICQILRHFSEI